MADKPASNDAPAPTDAPNKAQAEFEKYKARLGGAQPGMMVVPWGAPPGWGMPPSFGPTGGQGGFNPAAAAQAGAGIAGQLGQTLRLGIELLNAALSNGAAMLSGASAAWAGQSYGQSYGHGGGCGCCEPSCCEPMCAPSCCTPSVHGCC